jgi:ketosteroid isomerase-like protein
MEANKELTATTLERLQQASGAWYRSDPAPYRAMWSRREPVSLSGALGPGKAGWPEVETTFRQMATRFSDRDMTTDFEVVHVGSELAYTDGYEHGQVAIDGNRQPVKIRATHSYRREQDEWKLIHRHGDLAPVDDSPSVPMTSSGRAR